MTQALPFEPYVAPPAPAADRPAQGGEPGKPRGMIYRPTWAVRHTLCLPAMSDTTSGVGRDGGAACRTYRTEKHTVTLPETPPPARRAGVSGP